jgi:hypothetical protein
MMICRMPSHPTLDRLSSALTVRRLRVHGLLLAACLWSIYAFDVSTPGLLDRNGLVKGTDFVHFYVLGSLARAHMGKALYNPVLQSEIAHEIIPQAQPLYYVALYGPQVSVFFAPLAHLSYGWALVVWSLINTAVYAVCCFVFWKVCPRLRDHGFTVVILAIAYPAFFHLIAWGQTTAPALLCLTFVYLALRADREFLAGLALGLLIYKPQLGIAAAIVFFFSKQWKALAGAVLSGAAELTIGWLYYGTPVMRDYWTALGYIRPMFSYLEPRPYTVHCLKGFWLMLVPVPVLAFLLYLASAVAVIVVTVLVWRKQAPLSLRYSVLLIATVLVAPHLTVYDLLILAPAFLLLANWILDHGSAPAPLAMILYLCYVLPLIGPLSHYTHVQLSVLAFLALLYWLWRVTTGQNSRQAASV